MEQIKNVARDHMIPIMSDATREFLHYLLLQTKPKTCREVGTAIGRGSVHIAQTIAPRGGHLSSCEISHPSYQLALWHQWQYHLTNLTCYHADMLLVPHHLIPTLDFIFVDGMKSAYSAFIKYFIPHIHPQTIIVCDDVIQYGNKMDTLLNTAHACGLTTHLVPLADNDGVYVMSPMPLHELLDTLQ